MARITLTVVADTQKASTDLKRFKENIDKELSKTIEVKVAASGLDAITKDVIEYAKWSAKAAEAVAKLTKAEAQKINAQTKAAEAAAKLGTNQKQQVEITKAATQAAQKLTNANEELAQKFVEVARNDNYLEKRLAALYKELLDGNSAMRESTQALVAYSGATGLVIQNASNTERVIRNLAQAYLELAAAARGAGGYTMPSGGGNLLGSGSDPISERGTPYGNINWQRFLPYETQSVRTATDFSHAVDVEFRPVTEAAEAAGQAASRASSSFNTFRDSVGAAWTRLREGTPIADALGDSIGNIIVKITTWQVVNGIVAGIKRGFTDALDTMKAVDSELVTVRKVTGFTADEMKRVEEQAYKTASAYGVAADAYLESVAAFARAGYKEQSDDLAELSTKTQIVGDTTAEVANQFLLSVDAAYKYKGSIEELSKVLDGANELDNKYATSIEKIAEGMGIVAPVAAQMNVSIDELAAAIGTITAVTQRSGSEAARALRALFLNIAGDTKTEIDEGVTWTTGEIAGLRDVIKLYAKDAYDAAQATGSIIDPMKAMEGLAKSMQDGLLTEQKLIEMVSDIGGKLRTSQLLAIIQNWDMYQSMLTDYAGAIGSADREVENALDSWERKTAQLDNAFTEFISHIVSSDGIKAAIDILTGLVKVLDSGVGQVAALSAAFLGLGKIVGAISMSRTVQEIRNLNAGMAIVPQTALGAAHAVEGLGNKLGAFASAAMKNPAVVTTLISAVLYGLRELDDALTTTTQEYTEAVREHIDSYREATQELTTLNEKVEENNKLIAESNELGKDDVYRERLTEENARLEDQIQLLKERQSVELSNASQAAVGLANGQYGLFDDDETVSFVAKLLGVPNVTMGLEERFAFLQEWSQSGLPLAKEAGESLKTLTDRLLDTRDGLIQIRDAMGTLTPEEESALAVLNNLIGAYIKQIDVGHQWVHQIDLETDATEEEITVLEAAQAAFKALTDEIDGVQSALKILSDAQDEYNEYGSLSVDTVQKLLTLDGEYLAALIDENGQINLNADAISNLVEGKNVLLERLAAEAVAAYAAQEADRLLAEQEQDAGNAADTASGQLDNSAEAAERLAQSYLTAAGSVSVLRTELESFATGKGLKKNYIKEFTQNVTAFSQAATAAISGVDLGLGGWSGRSGGTGGSGGGGRSGGSGGGSGSTKDEYLEALKDNVALEKQRLSFLEASGANVEEQIAKQREIQEALHAQAEYLRSIGGDEKDIIALSTEWWNIQDKITKAMEAEQKAAEEAKKAELQNKQNDVARLKQELSFMEASGSGDLDAQIAKYREIQEALHEEAEVLRTIEGESTNVIALSTEWWTIQNKIDELLEKAAEDELNAILKGLSDTVALRKQELAYIEASGGSIDAQIAKYKEIQAALMLQVEQLKLNKAYLDGEVDALREVLAIETEIQSISGKIAELNAQMVSNMQAAASSVQDVLQAQIEEEMAKLQEAENSAIAAIDKEIEGLKKAHSARQDSVEAEEKLLAVEKARIALENAQRERNVRIYNASTGQWEWVANAQTVANAQDSYNNAQKALDDFTEAQALQAQIDALEASKEGVRDRFAKRAEAAKLQVVLDYLANTLDSDAAADSVAKMYLVEAMKENSEAWHSADEEGKVWLEAENAKIGKMLGWTKNSAGVWLDQQGRNAYDTYSGYIPDWLFNLSTVQSPATLAMREMMYDNSSAMVNAPADAAARLQAQNARLGAGLWREQGADGLWYEHNGSLAYEPGGYRTYADIFRSPTLSGGYSSSYANLLSRLGIVTANQGGYRSIGGTVGGGSIGTQNNGDVYQFGNITMTEGKAKTTTVYELAQMAGTLALYGN